MSSETTPVTKTDLSIELLGRKFNNPIILGSGTLGDSIERVNLFLASKIGGVIPRTTRLHYAPGRDHHPSPHLDVMSGGNMRNAEWTGATIDYWRPFLGKLSENGRTIISISGRDINGCLAVCQELDRFNFPFFEINISCAHSNDAHGFITRNWEHITTLVRTLKDVGIKTPLALKFGHSDYIVSLALAAQEAGADAIVAINTLCPVIDFDISSGKPNFTLGIAGGKGGLSGKAIFNIALTDVFDLSKHLTIPVIGCGGISSVEDVIKMIMAVASMVEVYTAAHLHGKKAPEFLNKLVGDVDKWLAEHGYSNISQIQGLALKSVSQNNQIIPLLPKLNKDLCTGCNKCVNICLEDGAISMINNSQKKPKQFPKIDPNHCIGCGACVSVCPKDAIFLEAPLS